jgi:RNA polymerase sigma-70 factor, ECF subfamily
VQVRSDAELVDAVLSGRQGAFATLVERHQRMVCAVAASVLGDHHAAEDAAQEAFVAAYKNLAGLRNPSAFGGWMARIVRRQALRMVGTPQPEMSLDQVGQAAAESRDGQLDEVSTRLLTEIMNLPEHERGVLMLRYFDGHRVEAIARMTGRPVGTVTKQLSRARECLREGLKEFER